VNADADERYHGRRGSVGVDLFKAIGPSCKKLMRLRVVHRRYANAVAVNLQLGVIDERDGMNGCMVID
jgi:hypothetical protein